MSSQAEELKEFKKLLDDGVITEEEYQRKKEEILGSFKKQGVTNSGLNIFHYYSAVFKKYATFEGRASRREYWSFFLVDKIIGIFVFLLMLVPALEVLIWGLSVIYSLVVFLPNLAVMTRRLHDTGVSGWWILVVLIPIAGPIVLFIYLLGESDPKTNMYGPSLT